MAGIGGRIGLSLVINLVYVLCQKYDKHHMKIDDYITNSTALSSDQKTVVLNWFHGIGDACDALQIIRIVWES